MMNDFERAVLWLLADRVRHGDVHQAKKAQEHLDAIGTPSETMALWNRLVAHVPIKNALRELDPVGAIMEDLGETAMAVAPLTGPAAPFVALGGAIVEGIAELLPGEPHHGEEPPAIA
jgi:hypothetical protein